MRIKSGKNPLLDFALFDDDGNDITHNFPITSMNISLALGEMTKVVMHTTGDIDVEVAKENIALVVDSKPKDEKPKPKEPDNG